MLSSSLYTKIKMSKTTYPQKLFPSYYITLYMKSHAGSWSEVLAPHTLFEMFTTCRGNFGRFQF